MNGLTLALLVGVGGALILRRSGVFTIGLLTSFILYARNFFEPLREITDVYNLVQSALAGVERVFEILGAPTEASPPDAVVLSDLRGEVEFRGVSFGYLPGQVVLEEVSLTARPGQSIAIVGPTGAGKTTLVNLLSRFYDVRSGSILVDGIDIRRLDLASLRTRMGVVLQEPFFFAASIRENILYGNPRAGEGEVLQAARLARADAFIRRLPARLRHGAAGAGGQPRPGGAAAAGHRPGHPGRPPHPGAGRGHLQRGQPDRDADPEGAAGAAEGADLLHHRPPPLHHPRAPTSSSCCTTTASSSAAPTTSCCAPAASTPASTPCSSSGRRSPRRWRSD